MLCDLFKQVENDPTKQLRVARCRKNFYGWREGEYTLVTRLPHRVLVGEKSFSYQQFREHFKFVTSINDVMIEDMINTIWNTNNIYGKSIDNVEIFFNVNETDALRVCCWNDGTFSMEGTGSLKSGPGSTRIPHCDMNTAYEILDCCELFVYKDKNEKEEKKMDTVDELRTFAKINSLQIATCHSQFRNIVVGSLVPYKLVNAGTPDEHFELYMDLNIRKPVRFGLAEFFDHFMILGKGSIIHPKTVERVVSGLFKNNLHNSFSTSTCTFFNLIVGKKKISIHVDNIGFDHSEARIFINERDQEEKIIKCNDLLELIIELNKIKDEDSEAKK